jgi:hypothetical protein
LIDWSLICTAFNVEITTILSIKHSRCNIRYISPSVTLSRDIRFVSVHGKGANEVLPEAHELCGHIVLIVIVMFPGEKSVPIGWSKLMTH